MATLPWLPVSELFYASYFSYYVMIAGVGLTLSTYGIQTFTRPKAWHLRGA